MNREAFLVESKQTPVADALLEAWLATSTQSRVPDEVIAGLAKGDLPGHPFRGNQYGEGTGGAQTDSPAFKEWFGESRVVKDGKPLVMFHGTSADFDAFATEAAGSGTLAADTEGAIFFTSSPAVAEDFAGYLWAKTPDGKDTERRFSRGANVMPVYLRAENPAIWDMSGGAYREGFLAGAIRDAKANGHDSIIFTNMRDGSVSTVGPWKKSHVVAVFSPTQIKSATGNEGTFSRDDARTTKGDLPGHAFRGNQWTDGAGASGDAPTVYHVTGAANLDSISETGLGGDGTGRQFFWDDEERARSFHKPHLYARSKVTLTFRRPATHEAATGADFGGFTREVIPPDAISVHDYGTGRDTPLLEYVRRKGDRSTRKGDLPGHEFRGNQYTNGGGAGGPDTPEFREWFAGSKVVDEKGRPQRVFRGSPVDEDADLSRSRANEEGRIWFTDDPENASAYSGHSWADEESASNVTPAYLSMQNPFEITVPEYTSWDAIPTPPEMKKAGWTGRDTVTTNDIADFASSDYDGVIIHNVTDPGGPEDAMPGTSYCVFDVSQAKSIFNRKPTATPDITKGDLPGHAFRGNQWTDGQGGGDVRERVILSQEEKDSGEMTPAHLKAWTREKATATARRLGFDHTRIMVEMGASPESRYMGRGMSVAGSFNPRTGLIHLYPNEMVGAGIDSANGPDGPVGVIAHEIGHAQYTKAIGPIVRDGKLTSDANLLKLAREDGVSDYSKMFWHRVGYNLTPEKMRRKETEFGEAMHETVAEINAKVATGVPLSRACKPAWRKFYREVMRLSGKKIRKGDLDGHPFRGNQWTQGQGGGEVPETKPRDAQPDLDAQRAAAEKAISPDEHKAAAAFHRARADEIRDSASPTDTSMRAVDAQDAAAAAHDRAGRTGSVKDGQASRAASAKANGYDSEDLIAVDEDGDAIGDLDLLADEDKPAAPSGDRRYYEDGGMFDENVPAYKALCEAYVNKTFASARVREIVDVYASGGGPGSVTAEREIDRYITERGLKLTKETTLLRGLSFPTPEDKREFLNRAVPGATLKGIGGPQSTSMARDQAQLFTGLTAGHTITSQGSIRPIGGAMIHITGLEGVRGFPIASSGQSEIVLHSKQAYYVESISRTKDGVTHVYARAIKE